MYDLAKRSLVFAVATGGLLLTCTAFSPALAATGAYAVPGDARAQDARHAGDSVPEPADAAPQADATKAGPDGGACPCPPPPPTCPCPPTTPPTTTPPTSGPPTTWPPTTTPPTTTPPTTTPPTTWPPTTTPPTTTPPTTPPTLPKTGAGDIDLALGVAGASLISGLGLRVASRRREKEE